MSGSCSMFRIGVGLHSGEAASPDTVYNKIVNCEDVGYMSLSTSDKCLKWYNSPLTPIEANLSCQSNVGNLFRITSSDMFQEILNITTIIDPTYTVFTIDGNDIAQEGTWVFSDGSAFDTDLLASDQPNGGTLENCLVVVSGGLIHDYPCDPYSFQYICERYLVL
uniref:Uncharacterized protein LOC111110213 n=1 Tax=Crassostrea virginica TaxID=6565 RepID=A0A8B8BG31_CRAVI|nr:uncharacterized protein LOC111110213 [Crassostrea virginica]